MRLWGIDPVAPVDPVNKHLSASRAACIPGRGSGMFCVGATKIQEGRTTMPAYLERTTAQKVRDFLNALQVAPPPTASAREIETLLISRVRARRDDPAARQRLRELLADLLTLDSARLPAPECETLDPAAFADELASLLAGRTTVSFKAKPRPATVVFAAALLLAGAVAINGCGKKTAANSPDCAADTSADHFDELASEGTGLTPGEIAAAETDYQALSAADQEKTMAALCGMSAHDISNYLRNRFNIDDDNDSNNGDDDATPYKGVSF
jgi:hypothetical protein